MLFSQFLTSLKSIFGVSAFLGFRGPPLIIDDVIKNVWRQHKLFYVIHFVLSCFTYVPSYFVNRDVKLEILRGAESAPPPGPEEPLKSPVHIGLNYFIDIA